MRLFYDDSVVQRELGHHLTETTDSYVRKWLESSGRALELRAARTLRQVGLASVEPSLSYKDVVTDRLRETDVVARFTWLSMESVPSSITAAVECKSGRKHAWVAFYADDEFEPRKDLDDWVTFAHGPFVGVTQGLPELWIGQDPFVRTPVATHVVAARNADSGTEDDKNPAGDAVRQVLSATSAIRSRYIANQTSERIGLVCVPIIVTSAPLISCRLDDRGDVQIEPVEQVDVWGYDERGVRRRIYVRSEKSLIRMADALRACASRANQE